MNRKGFVALLEMIIVVVALFVAFQIFFPGFSYKSRWDDALLMLKGRDLILVMDRIGKLHFYSYNGTATSQFLDTLIPFSKTNIIGWSESEGSIKSKITIACNCTNEQMVKLRLWLDGLKINGKPIDAISAICLTDLEMKLTGAINPCLKNADVLLIWGYKELKSEEYANALREYLKFDNGVVEIMDFTAADQLDSPVQQKIFGLKWETAAVSGLKYENFTRKPDNTIDVLYGPYKFFYHIPMPVEAVGSEAVSGCSINRNNKGVFKVNNTDYRFWICTGSSVKFDEDGNNLPDKTVRVGDSFSLNSSKFFLNYIDLLSEKNRTGISFRPDFKFKDFLDKGSYITTIYQLNNDAKKILLGADKKYANGNYVPAIVLNNSEGSRIAWMADFKDDGDYEYRAMLTSLLLWASNKRAIGVLSPTLKVGFRTSYVNVINNDMFEVYKYNLGLGYPY
jgi:hypothetical protein